MRPRLLMLPPAPAELGQRKLTMGDKRTHAQFFGERERLLVGVILLLSVSRCPGVNVAELLQAPGFPPSLLMVAGQCQRLLGMFARLRVLSKGEIGVGQECGE